MGTGAWSSKRPQPSWLCRIWGNQYCGHHSPNGANWLCEDKDLWRQAILASYPGWTQRDTGWSHRHLKFLWLPVDCRPRGQSLTGTAEQSWALPYVPSFGQGAMRYVAPSLHCPSLYICLMSTPSLGPQEVTWGDPVRCSISSIPSSVGLGSGHFCLKERNGDCYVLTCIHIKNQNGQILYTG